MIDKTMNWTAPLGWTPSYGDYISAQRVLGDGEDLNGEGLRYKNGALNITRTVRFFKIAWMRLRFICLHPNADTPFLSYLFGSLVSLRNYR